MTHRMDLRLAALDIAAYLEPPRTVLGPHREHAQLTDNGLLATADRFYRWLTAPVRLDLTFGPVTDQATGKVATTAQGDRAMSNLELGDSQQTTATVAPRDAANQPTGDTLTWSASIPDAVVLTPSADTLSCIVAGAVPAQGVVITATDSLGNTVSGELDVVAGEAASLSLQFGPVTAQTPAQPAAPATDTAPAESTTDDSAAAASDAALAEASAPTPAAETGN